MSEPTLRQMLTQYRETQIRHDETIKRLIKSVDGWVNLCKETHTALNPKVAELAEAEKQRKERAKSWRTSFWILFSSAAATVAAALSGALGKVLKFIADEWGR